jgi:hypothetical protein
VGSQDNVLYVIEPNTPTPTCTPTSTYTPTVTSTPTPDYNYIELMVLPNNIGGDDFFKGDYVVVEWEAHPDLYGFENIPVDVYLGVTQNPPDRERVTLEELTASTTSLYLFDSSFRTSPYDPTDLQATYSNIAFPLRGSSTGNRGTLVFTVPKSHTGIWAFATAFIRKDNGEFPADPPIEVSNGFTLE